MDYAARVLGPRKAAGAFVARYLGRLRFPQLLLLTGTLFIVDLVVPDVIPLVDEILLGLGTLVLANLKKRGEGDPTPAEEAPRA